MNNPIFSILWMLVNHLVWAPSTEPAITSIAINVDSTASTQHIAGVQNVLQETQIYRPDIPGGVIGTNASTPIDKLEDNIFHFEVSNPIQPNDLVFLQYKLKGVQDYTAVAKSFNDQQSFGGYLINPGSVWSKQIEPVNPNSIKLGKNVLRFHIPNEQYPLIEVQDLQLVVRKNTTNQRSARSVTLHQPALMYHGQKVYLKGHLSGPQSQLATIELNGLTISNQNGDFETILEREITHKGPWEISMTATFPDGRVLSQNWTFQESKSVELEFPIENRHLTSTQLVAPGTHTNISNQLAELIIPDSSLLQFTPISLKQLRNRDLPPLPNDIVNVSPSNSAVRCLPDGIQFQHPVTLKIPFDDTLIPRGYSAKDVRTFYFDETKRKWLALPKDSVDTQQKIVTSTTTHFTDFINAVIKVPESPQTNGFTPTSMQGLQAASPAQGIVPIAPPTANAMGNANVSFPLKLPLGRKGIQPDLSVNYNSEGGNGWLGLGWSLDLPAIEVETRWGVPRYLAALESETYTLNGEQLYPVAHRSELKPRQGNTKIFHLRVEGAFQKIIRHGTNPKNYHWEIIDQNGTKHFYGSVSEGESDENSTLKDDQGNIAHWAIVETRDLEDNFIKYTYEIIEDAGVQGSTFMGRQIYPAQISYTGHGNTAGPYTVTFHHQDKSTSKRVDVEIDARHGFKKVTAELLQSIDIAYNGSLIRSYQLNYKIGVFYKTLLQGIAELDKNGDLFYENTFEYYDEVQSDGEFNPMGEAVEWGVSTDNLKTSILSPLPWINGETTVISGSKSSNFDIGTSVTVGAVAGNYAAKTNTAGGNYSFTTASSEGLTNLMDISGDGLPDKTFFNGSKLFYRPNLGDRFGNPISINFNKSFEKTSTKTHSAGLEAHPGGGYISANRAWSESKTSTYIIDLNGDGLIDIADENKGYFNYFKENGLPAFSTNSALTPSPVIEGTLTDVGPPVPTADEIMERAERFPLHDAVRMWRAPKSGMIDINGLVELINNNTPEAEEYELKDGITASIQVGGNVRWRENLPPDGPTSLSPTNVNNISVNKGDQVYFRLQSIQNGLFDQVKWDPDISYQDSIPTYLDPNGKNILRYKAFEDFITASNQVVTMPMTGQILMTGIVNKPITSDDIALQITRNRNGNTNLILDQIVPWNETMFDSLKLSFDVIEGDELTFLVSSATNVDWSAIQWRPQIQYDQGSSGNEISFCPSVHFTMYNDVLKHTPYWIAPDTNTYNIQAYFHSNNHAASYPATFSVKGVKKLYEKAPFQVIGNNPVPNQNTHTEVQSFDLTLNAGDTLFFEYHFPTNPALLGFPLNLGNAVLNDSIVINYNQVGVDSLGGQFPLDSIPVKEVLENKSGQFTTVKAEDIIFGPLYRGWGQFAYNGNLDRANDPINESELNANEYEIDQEIDEDTDPADIDVDISPGTTKFIIMVANAKSLKWEGPDTLVYITGNEMGSSRLGEDDILGSGGIPTVGADCKFAPTKISKSTTWGGSAGFKWVSVNGTNCDNRSVVDFMDMNGDRYPDIVYEDRIKFTDARGGLSFSINYEGKSHEATSFSKGGGAAGSPGNSNTSNSGGAAGSGSTRSSVRAKARSSKSSYNAKESSESASFAGALSASVNVDDDYAKHSWMDINGDGLPDKVFEGGDVALNLGYSFGPRERWGFSDIRKGQSVDITAGVGVNLFNGSIEAGVSSSLSMNVSSAGLQDVNGDGLVDRIIGETILEKAGNDVKRAITGQQNDYSLLDKYAGQVVEVQLNTGNGFAAEKLKWHGFQALDGGSSVAESINGAFTFCVPIIIARLCFNPNSSKGQGVSRQENQLADMNGDGFPDFVQSENDAHLSVSLSKIGKTNLLERIKRPFGSSMTIDYALVGNTRDLPFGKWVLSETSLNDGLPGDGADVMKFTFEYGSGYYNRHERQFYGFDTVLTHQIDTEKEDEIYRTSLQTFYNKDYYRKGLARSSTLFDQEGNPFTETLYSYTLKNSLDGSDIPIGFEQSDTMTIFPALIETTARFFEGQPQAGLSQKMNFTYDNLGNITQYVDWGDGSAEDKLTANMTYHDIESIYLKSSPKSMTVETVEGIVRRKEADIDNSGNLTQIRMFLKNGDPAVYNFTYNNYGMLEKVERPENANGERLFYAYQYDDQVQTYITEIADAYGYTSSTTYEYEFGQVLEHADLNGYKMVYTIDDRGRYKNITGPYELASGAPYTISYEYVTDVDRPYTITKHFDPEHEQDIATYTFVDGLLRTVQTKKTGSVFQGPGQPDQLQLLVSGKTIFDAFGRTTAQYYPTTEPIPNATTYNPNADNISPITTTYDVLDRDLTTELPDGATTTKAYGFGENNLGKTHFRTTITDPLSNIQEIFTDVRNRERSRAAHGPDGIIWINFAYNALSELVQVIDHHDNTTNYTYDHFGRQISRSHPDGGLVTFEYDLANNLIKKVTADIRENIPNAGIQYSYEYERLTGIDYPRNFQNKVQMHYGKPDADHNRAGRVWLIEDASGGTELHFGPLGETIKTVRTILTSEGNVRTFVSESTYDTWSRIQEMIYPDGETVDYVYNQAGQLQSMSSQKGNYQYPIIDQLGYDKFEEQVFCAFGNGTQTSYTFEPDRRRLQSLIAQNQNGQAFINNQYAYDPIGNILNLQNMASASGQQLGGSTNYQYQYDQLYRLTGATGTWSGDQQSADFQLSMSYDNLHNISRKTQVLNFAGQQIEASNYNQEYWYEAKQPHAASDIGNRSLTYDPNGNLTYWQDAESKESQRFIWDEENRLMGVSKDGYMSQYTYDAGGERAVKSHGPSRGVFANGVPIGATTINHYHNYKAYVSPYFVVDELNFTKHYYYGSERVLSKIGAGEFNNDYWNFRGVTAGNKNYVKRLQLLQQAYFQHIQTLNEPPGEPTVPKENFPIPGLDSLPSYDNTFPDGWPRPIFPDTTGAPGEPTLVEYADPDSAYVNAGYGYYEQGATFEGNQFFYHGDHLGSSNYITDATGTVRQHQEYFPFGETFVDQHVYTEEQPYLFNAKELDNETGLYYYGARYYDPSTSVWLGVDPLFEKYPSLSPYAYVANNPIKYVDPDGRYLEPGKFLGYTQGGGPGQKPTLYFEHGHFTQEHDIPGNVGWHQNRGDQHFIHNVRADVHDLYGKNRGNWNRDQKTYLGKIIQSGVTDDPNGMMVEGDVFHRNGKEEIFMHPSRGRLIRPGDQDYNSEFNASYAEKALRKAGLVKPKRKRKKKTTPKKRNPTKS